jgi:hypothetical protein
MAHDVAAKRASNALSAILSSTGLIVPSSLASSSSSRRSESASISELGLLVEHHARVTQTRDLDPCLFEILIPTR